jgi:hypothetical protein
VADLKAGITTATKYAVEDEATGSLAGLNVISQIGGTKLKELTTSSSMTGWTHAPRN